MRLRLLLGLVVLAAVVVAAVLLLSGGGGSRTPEQSVSAIAAAVVPGSTAVLAPPAPAQARSQILKIVLPDSVLPPTAGSPRSSSAAASIYAAAGWRGTLIAAVAAIRRPGLTKFATTGKHALKVPGSAFFLDGSVRLAPGQNPAQGMTRLDTISPAAATRQLNDNLAVLRRGLPAGSITGVSVKEIPIDPAHRRFALAVELRVKDLPGLRRHFGDVFNGLGIGLAPGPASTIEGLAIHVVDGRGHNAGSWIATRAQQGTTVIDPRVHPPAVMVPRLPFVNETGGPGPVASAHAGPAP
ncbi:MAG: hypothetical protein QOF77_447 [Solirubrobacteraceae bacterium]|nr:hypothetical protein [Solirubrobacteraceae bacterium]